MEMNGDGREKEAYLAEDCEEVIVKNYTTSVMFCLGFGVERHPDRGGSVFKMSRRGAVEFNDLIQRQN